MLPVFKPRRGVPFTAAAAANDDDDDDEDDDGMVAILQLVRPHGAPPLTDDDVYLCELLAPHLAHALAGAQGVESRKVTSEQYQHIVGTAQTLGKAKETQKEPKRSLLHGENSSSVEAADGVRDALVPPKLAASGYSLERLRAAMRDLFACDDALVYMPRDPNAVLRASKRGTGTKRRSAVTPASHGELARAQVRGSGGNGKPMVPLLPEGVKSRTGLASVNGMEELCVSGEPLVLVASASSPRKGSVRHNAAMYARNLDAVGKSAKTVVRSMLCVPALLHRSVIEEVLGKDAVAYLLVDGSSHLPGEPEPLIPCLLQWINRCGNPAAPLARPFALPSAAPLSPLQHASSALDPFAEASLTSGTENRSRHTTRGRQ